MLNQIKKRVLAMLMTLAMVISLMPALTLPAKALNATFVQDAYWDDSYTGTNSSLDSTNMQLYKDDLGAGSTVVNYIGDLTTLNGLGRAIPAKAALKFTIPASSGVLISAKLNLKVIDVVGNPTATITLTDDNSWEQTNDGATSSFPTLTNAVTLVSGQAVTTSDWNTFSLPVSNISGKISSTENRTISFVVTGTTAQDNWFNFVADDNGGTNVAELVLTFAPAVTSVSVPSNGTYKIGDALDFTVAFDSVVIVTGTPRIPVNLNTGDTAYASYVAGSGSKNLVFRYTVSSGELDADGISLGSAISLNSGTIKTSGNDDAELNLYSVATTTGVLVDGAAPSISIISAPGNATYNIGDTLDYTINFSEPVNVVTAGGTPYLTLTLGSSTVHAAYLNGSGGSTLTFRYTVVSGDADADGVALASNVTLNGGTIKDAAGNSAILTFIGSTAAGVLVSTAPKVTDANISISGASGMGGAYKIGDTVTATWNNTAVGGDNSANITSVTVDFSQFGGGAAVSATNNSGTWTATYTIVAGAIDATGRNVSVTVTDALSKSTTTADTTNATLDNVASTVTDSNISISGGTGTGGAYKIGDTVTATWNNTAGGDNNADTTSGVTVNFSQFGGGAAVAATNSSGTWTATYTIASGAIDSTNRNISFTVTDNAGNTTTTADTSNANVDNVAPTVTDGNISISGASGTGGAFKTGDTVTATWNNTAGGDNNSDTISSVTVDFTQFGGGAAVAATNSSGTWTATYTITAGAVGTTNRNVSFTVTDNAGNTTTRNDTTNATVDNIAPTVSISSTAGANTNTSPIPVTITFSESVTGFDVGDITVGNGTAGNFVAVSGTTYTADITPSAQGTVTVDVAVNVAQDAAGNNNTAATQLSRTYDNTAPTVTITSAAQTNTNTSPIPVTITFSESVTGFVIGDITVGNGTASNFVAVSGTTYTADITPSAQGAVTVDIAANVALDATGNNNTAATQLSKTYDTTAPTAPTVTSAAASTNNTTPTWTWTAGGGGNGTYRYKLDSNDLTSGTTQTTTASYTPASALNDGVHTLYVQERDEAGNWSASDSYAVTIDGTSPTVTITSAAATNTNTSPIPVTITFSESVTGFDVGDITVGNGTAGNFSAVSGTTYTADITPGAQGAVTVDVAANVAQDAAGNNNTAATRLSRTYDNAAPTVTITSSAQTNTNTSPIPVTITFSKSVTGFAIGDITVGNGTASNFVVVSGTTYTVDIIPSAQGAVTVDIASNVALDATGNNNTAATQLSKTYDTTAPAAGNTGTIVVSELTYNFAKLTWTAATDLGTLAANLQYKIVFSTSNITTVVAADALSGTWTSNITTLTVTGLTASTDYFFNVLVKDEAGNMALYSPATGKTTAAPVNDSPSTPTPPQNAVVEVNGEKQDAGKTATETTGGTTTTTITVDDMKLDKILEEKGNNATVTLPASGSPDVVVGQLTGQTVKNMETKEAVLEIKTETVTYTLPASQINIDRVSSQFGTQVDLKDIKVSVKIAEPPAETVKIVENTASRDNYQIVVKPVEFEITCTSGGHTVEVSRFNGYVERTIAIPDGIDPSKITTGIVLNSDGTFSHVPTSIVLINGKYFAKINSLTNSTYSVIYNPVTFTDVSSHWAKNAINDMGSRMVVTGIGNGIYEPERSITRAEFAAIVVRAMGLKKGTTESAFGDVTLTDWFNGYVDTATSYSLITGYDSESYGPYDIITREQAMTILARAMKLTGFSVTLTDSEASALLANYTDAGLVSDYAKTAAAACIKTGIVSGTTASTLSPKDSVTRAEVAAMVQRLLQNSGLI